MLNYTKQKIEEGFYSIEQDFVRCFLFIGEKEALLVDTGVGGNLRDFVEEITSLPIKVLITHADHDHTGAAIQFISRLMHPSEMDYYQSKHDTPCIMEPIWEGDIIDLGNYQLEAILIPGHTPGSIALLEKNKRFLIGGDSVQTGKIFMFGAGRNFDAYQSSMQKLQKMTGYFDTVYASHGDLMVKPEIINQLYIAAGKVKNKEVEGKPEKLHDFMINCYETDGVAFYAY